MIEHIDDLELDRRLAEDLAALYADLDRVLDLDAGLAAILPTGWLPSTTPRRDPIAVSPGDLGTGTANAETREVAELRRFARALASMPAAARLHARLWLPRPALSTIRLLVSMGRPTRENLRTRAEALTHALTRVRHLHHARDLALAPALDHARDLTHALASATSTTPSSAPRPRPRPH